MNDADFVQQLASLNWLVRGDLEEHRQLYTAVTGGRVIYEAYQRLTKQREIDELRNAVTLKIADYCKKQPRASQAELVKVVAEELQSFANAVKQL